MPSLILICVGGYCALTGAYIWIATQHWYQMVPGVAETGPLNLHFARDIALAYLTSGVALVWAGLKDDMSAGLCGAFWPLLHAVFHIWIWFHRGAPADLIALSNLIGIQIRAFAGLIAAVNLNSQRART